MKLTDIAPISSDVLNTKMKDKLGWNIKTENLSVKDAEVMLESVANKLNAVRSSSKIHASEKDPNYTGMLMAQQVLENYIAEAKKAKNPYAVGMAQAMKSTGDKPPLEKSTIKKAHKIAKKVKANESSDDVEEGNEFTGALAAAKKAGKDSFKVGGKTFKVNEAEAKLKKTVAKDKKSKKIDESINAAIKRMINEDEVTQAQSVMAAKDMVDSLQGMLEDISRMVNEELPPLTDSIRGNIGDSQASTFQSSVQQTLNDLLSQVQGARESVNNAVLGLTGQAPTPMDTPADMGADLGAELDAEEPADDFGASDAAVGGELPLGREKRA